MNKKNAATENKSFGKKWGKKIYNLLLNLSSLTLLAVFLVLAYFLILISTEYKSFPFVTHAIEKEVNDNLDNNTNIKIGQSAIKFSGLHKINIKLDDIKLSTNGKKSLVLPKIEAEFSIFNLALLRTFPSKITIIAPEILIDTRPNNKLNKPQIVFNDDGNRDNDSQDYLQQLSAIFLLLKNNDIAIRFNIENAKITFRTNDGNHDVDRIIILKESKIKTEFIDDYLSLNILNNIKISDALPNLLLNGDCQFKNVLKCDMSLFNFFPASIAPFHKQLKPLDQIDAKLSGNISAVINQDYQLSDLIFDFNTNSGSFNYPQFFSQKIDFKNFSISGKLDNVTKTLNIFNLSTYFNDSKFDMALKIDNFMDYDHQSNALELKINNFATDNLDKFWPVFLNGNNIRKWVIDHIKGGVIKDGYAQMTLEYNNGKEKLKNINAKINFSGLNLQYSPYFPPISKIDGQAGFTEKAMKVAVTSGEVLDSKINSAIVEIPHFDNHKLILNVSGKLSGAAADLLKHINYKSAFASTINNYFNGNADTSLDIKIPLIQNLQLKDISIKVAAHIKNFNNDYITKDSDLIIDTNKELSSGQFITKIDLTNANIDLKQFNIRKNKNIASHINTILSVERDGYLQLKNFDWRQDPKKRGGKPKRILGSLLLKLDPVQIININLRNYNFSHGNFTLNYNVSNDSRQLKLTGDSVDLRPFLANKSDQNQDSYQKNVIEIKLDNLLLANDQHFKNVNIDVNCDKLSCKNGFIKANLGNNKTIDVKIIPEQDHSSIEGNIGDLSLIAKAFDLSNQIVGGDAQIKAAIQNDHDLPAINGELIIDSGITVLKNSVVEKISQHNAFSGVKNKIDSSNEINFDDLKLQFILSSKKLDIKTLIASSYLIGFTAKGKIDFEKHQTNLKGLIVPGYALNKVFGIGKIPILGNIVVGEEGGGIFAVRYDYIKNKDDKEGNFSINPASAIIPGGIRNVFDLF